MRGSLRRRRQRATAPQPAGVRWFARLALLTLLLQLASLGHWSLGPFHADGALETHTSHCHGDSSACGGQPAFAGTYIERPLTLTASTIGVELYGEAGPTPAGATLPLPEHPPRAA